MKYLAMVTLLLASANPADSQTYWRYSSGVAGATLGGGFGWVLKEMSAVSCGISFSASDSCGRSHPELPLAMAAGLGLLGYLGGLEADRALAKGESLSSFRQFQLRAQLVVTPVLLPPLLLANMKPDKTRQALTWAGMAGGAVTGYLLQRKYKPATSPGPKIGIVPTSSGIALQFSTRW